MLRGSIQDVYKYWNDRPCNVRHSTKSQDTVEFFDEVAAKKYKVEDHKLEFLALEKWSGKRVLELGCGLGTDAISFAKAGAHVTCVDLTDSGIELCRKNFHLHGLSGEFFVGNIEDLDTFLPAENQYDLIYSFGVIHHTPNPAKVFEKAARYLKDDGELRCMLYSRFSYKLFWLMDMYNDWSFAGADSLIQNYSEAQSGCPVTYTYTFDEIAELIAPHFKVEKIWKDHIFCWEIEPYKRNEFVLTKPFEGLSDSYFSKMKKELGWHTMFIARKN
jgi:SAM-dependent methyltransferase